MRPKIIPPVTVELSNKMALMEVEIWSDGWVAGFTEGAGRAPTEDDVKESQLTNEKAGQIAADLVNKLKKLKTKLGGGGFPPGPLAREK